MGRKSCAQFVFQSPRICASPHSSQYGYQLGGLEEMIAPQSELGGWA